MLTRDEFTALGAVLSAPGSTLESKYASLKEVRENLDVVQSPEYAWFLETFLGPLQQILQVTPVSRGDSIDSNVRHLVLEILSKLHPSEAMRNKASDLLDTLTNAMFMDNEDNCVLCLKIHHDIHRYFRPALESKIGRFLEFIKQIYSQAAQTYASVFPAHIMGGNAANGHVKPDFRPGIRSFKVLIEVPQQIMLLLNAYPRGTVNWAPPLVTFLISFVSLVDTDLVNDVIHKKNPDPRLLADYVDYKTAQCKTLSLLVHMIRTINSNAVKPHHEALAVALVNALASLHDSVQLRREMLIASRHVLALSARQPNLASRIYYPKLAVLLDEDNMVGRSTACKLELRSLAINVVAEVLNHVRMEITFPELKAIVHKFARYLHDDTIISGTQNTCARLLANLVEVAHSRRADPSHKDQYRLLQAYLLDIFVSKLSSLRKDLPSIVGPLKAKRLAESQNEETTSGGKSKSSTPRKALISPFKDKSSGTVKPSQGAESAHSPGNQPDAKPDGPAFQVLHTFEKPEVEKKAADAKVKVQVLISGLKSVLWSLTTFGTPAMNSPMPIIPDPASSILREEELRLASKGIASAIPCLRLFSLVNKGTEMDFKCYDQMAEAISVVQDPRDVVELLSQHMTVIAECMAEDPRLLRMVMVLLGSNCQRHFASILLQFLMDNQLQTLQNPGSPDASLTMKLFTLFMDALKKFPQSLEPVFAPQFAKFINQLVTMATASEDKTGYVDLMLTLFRNLTNGAFDQLFIMFGGARDGPALLPRVLNLLLGILDGPNTAALKTKVIEACLITPSRLSEQLAALPSLMKPLVLAMEGKPDLVQLALRTLEYWVDSLNPEFLEPAMASVSDRILTSLTSHLKLPPYQFGSRALQLLGKLGGRNRRSKEIEGLNYRDNTEHGIRLVLTFQPSTSFLVPLDVILQICQQTIDKRQPGLQHVHHRREAFKLIKLCVVSLINIMSPTESALPGRSIDKLTTMLFTNEANAGDTEAASDAPPGIKTALQLNSEQQVLKTLIATLLGCAGDPDIKEIAQPFMEGMCRHFALLYAAGAGKKQRVPLREATKLQNSLKCMDPSIFLDALMQEISHEERSRSDAALKGMKIFATSLIEVCQAQRRLHTQRLAAQVDGSPADPQDPDKKRGPPKTSSVESLDGQKSGSLNPTSVSQTTTPGSAAAPANPSGEKSAEAEKPETPKLHTHKEGAFPTILDELLGKIIHLCHGETWGERMGGATAMLLLGGKIPVGQLMNRIGPSTKALMAVLRHLPEHAVGERKQIRDSMIYLIRRCLLRSPRLKGSLSEPSSLCLKNVIRALDGQPTANSSEPPAKRQKTESSSEDQVMKEVGGSQDGSAKGNPSEPARVTGALRPAQEERCIHNLIVVAASEVFNPRASAHIRSAADEVLQILSQATGKTLNVLLDGMLEKFNPPLSKRKLFPLKHIPQHTGFVASLTYCLQQKPPLVGLVPEVFQMIKDAHTVCESDNATLLKDLTGMQRQAGTEQLPELRMQCLKLTCAALSWPEFNRVSSDNSSNANSSEAASNKSDDDSSAPTPAPTPTTTTTNLGSSSPQVGRLKHSIIDMLFKQLTATDKETVTLAQEGLELHMTLHKIPKQLLQVSLRPILMNLAHYNQLKLPLLQGLARLLKLLTAWFNSTLGEKLIDHLRVWLDPQKLMAAEKSWESGQDSEVAAGILELFHMLPNAAVSLLETGPGTDGSQRPGLVVMVIELEKALYSTPNNMQPTKLWSPYRPPLARFLNKFAKESVDYFLEAVRMAAPMYFWLLLDLVRAEIGRPLLDELATRDVKLAQLLDPADDTITQNSQLNEAQFNSLHLLAVMAKRVPTCVTPLLFETLQKRWNHPARLARLHQEDALGQPQNLESKWIIKCMIKYIDQHREEVDALFELVGILVTPTRINFDFFRRFLGGYVVSSWSVDEKRRVVEHFWRHYGDSQAPRQPKEVLNLVAKLLVRPIIENSHEPLHALITPELKTTMMRALMSGSESLENANVDDEMNVETLQMLSHIIHTAPQLFEDNPQEVMRFSWSVLRKEDSVAKYQAFYTLCRYLERFPAPEKTGFQVFFNLLRANQNDSRRPLICHALDILTPVMAAAAHKSDAERVLWAKYMRKMVIEESQSFSQMTHIWQLAVRHADIFYPIRAWFAPQMINNLMKIGLQTNASADSRRLTIDMASLIIYWEKCRIANTAQNSDQSAGNPNPGSGSEVQPSPEESPPNSATDTDVEMLDVQADHRPAEPAEDSKGLAPIDFKIHPHLQEALVAFLTRMVLLLGDTSRDQDPQAMKRAIEVIEQALQVWPAVSFKLAYIERLAASNMDKFLNNQIEFPATVNSALLIIAKAIHVQPLRVIQNSSQQINILIDACFKIENEAIVEELVSVLSKVYQTCPPNSTGLSPAKAIQDRLQVTINDNLTMVATSPDAITPNISMPGVCATLKIMHVLEGIIPGLMTDAFLPHLVKLFTRIAAENLTCSGQVLVAKLQNSQVRNLTRDAVIVTSNPAEYGGPVWAMKEMLKLMRGLLPKMGDQVEAYLEAVMQLVQGSAARVIDPHILLEVLDSLKEWIMDPSVANSHVTEKHVLQMLQSFALIQHDKTVPANIRTEFERRFLAILYLIISSPTSMGQTFGKKVFDEVERPYMLGLRSVSIETRKKFFNLYNRTIAPSLFERLKFILCIQNWENLASTFWLKEALDMIIATLVGDEPIKLAPNSSLLPCLLAKTKGNVYTWRESQEGAPPPGSAPQGAPGVAGISGLTSIPSQGILNQRPMLSSMLGRPYNPSHPNYALAHYAGLASQAYPQGQPQGFPAGANPPGSQTEVTGAAQSQPINMQMFLRPNMGQPGILQQQGLQALSMGGRPSMGPNPQAGQTQQMGVRPGYLPSQQSVAHQLLSQQPIASHPLGQQGGQPVVSQGQFMAGAAQMASRPPSLLSTAMGMHLRPQQQGSQPPGQASVPLPAGIFPQGSLPQGLATGSAGMLTQFPGMQQANQNLRPRGQVAPQQGSLPYPSAGPAQPQADTQQQASQGVSQPETPAFGQPGQASGPPVPSNLQGGLAQISAQQTNLLGAASPRPAQAAPPGLMPGQASNPRSNMLGGTQPPGQYPSGSYYAPQQQGAAPGYSPGQPPQGDLSSRLYSNLQSLSSVIASQQMSGLQRTSTAPTDNNMAGVSARPPQLTSQNSLAKSTSQVFNPFNLPALGAKASASKEDGLGERQLYNHLDLPTQIDEMMHEHCRFMSEHGTSKVEDLVSSLSEIMFLEPRMAYHIWVLIFPIVWATLSDTKERQIQLAKPIIQLLSKEFHSAQSHKRPNVIQALMEGISLSQPQPKVPSELIKFVGKKFNAWHISIPLLESHSGLFPQEQRCFDALAELYSTLNEEDMLHGLWKLCANLPETKHAVAWAQHGRMENAQECLTNATEKAASKPADGEGNQPKPSKSEQAYWLDLWVQISFELGQWDNIQEYSSNCDNFDLLSQALAKTHNWATLRDEVIPAVKLDESPSVNILQSCLMLSDMMLGDGEYQANMAVNKLLEKQWMLPELSVAPHLPLLSQFQQIIELNESVRLLQDLSGRNGPNHQFRDLKDIMETWRLRTPNEWDDFTAWSDVLVWRSQIYNIVIDAFKNMSETAPQLYQIGYRDKAWTVNKLAYVARKHKSLQTAKIVINGLYGFNAMEVQEAFTKIKEQAKCFMADPELRVSALNLLNSQNLEYFGVPHQSELFRLRGICQQELEMYQDADDSFSTALTVCSTMPDGWLSWAVFCDGRYMVHKDPILIESAATAYLQAIRHGSVPARGMIPRLLNLLVLDSDNGMVGKALERGCRQIAHWIWLQWLPQLIVNLQRPEGAYCRRILCDLSRLFPQALYFGLRAHLLVTREAAHRAMAERNKKLAQQQQQQQQAAAAQVKTESESSGAASAAAKDQQPSPNPVASGETPASTAQAGAQPTAVKQESSNQRPSQPMPKSKKDMYEVVAFEHGREIMDLMQQSHSVLCKQLESLCSELGLKFAPRPEERLMGVVHALLHRMFKLPYSNLADVPQTAKKELISVCTACFVENPNKPARMSKQYKEAFLRDLNPEDNPNFPKTLGDLATKLKTWRHTLHQSLSSSLTSPHRLEDESRTLSDFTFGGIEMPGQYSLGDEVTPESVVKLECIGSNVTIIQRHWAVLRRLAFIGSNGKTRHFVVHHVHHQFNTGDERMMQLLRGLNKQLDKQPQSRKRSFVYHTPIIVPIWPQVRLVEEEESYATYAEAYEINSARHGKEPDGPMVRFKQMCCTETGQMVHDPQYTRRELAYTEIIRSHVSENIFSQFIYKLLPTCNHLWVFKKTFCTQMALSGLFSYLLSVGGRSPPKLLFAKANAKVFQAEFFCQYDEQFKLLRHDPLPFRLTRNLQSFFTPFGVEGLFVSTLAIAAEALTAEHSQVEEDLALFQKDDVLSWLARKTNKSTIASVYISASSLAELSRRNAKGAMSRLLTVAPPSTPDMSQDPQAGAHMLVAQATDIKNLCRMDPTWQPWF